MDMRISSKTSVVIAIIAAVLAALGAPAAAAPPDDIIEYSIPTADSNPWGIVAGPDGNLWFTEEAGNKIGRITPTGTITEYPLPTADSFPRGIAAGPDGNLWFAEISGNRIGRITPTGTITEYPLPTADSNPQGIAAGPDGNMWFTEPSGNKIGRITPDGTITEFPVLSPQPGYFGPHPISGPWMIAAGPDGNLWFTGHEAFGIGRITPTGTVTVLGDGREEPEGIAAGPDGNLWFTESGANRIGRITPTGDVTEYPLPRRSGAYGIAAGPDGNMWFTEPSADRIGRITTGGAITEYPLPRRSGAYGITAGPDGNMWFTERSGERIGRISPTAPPTAVKYPCPVHVTLHKPTPKTVGNRILTDKITTNTTSCHLLKPVVLCRPLDSTTAGENTFCETKITKRGTIRVKTQGYEAVRVTVIVRAKPKPGFADRWKPDTWRKAWLLGGSAAAKNKGETDLTLSKGLVQGMDAAGVGIKAIRGATLSKSGVVTFRVKSVRGDVITHKGALLFSSSVGFVTLQNIALNYTTGKATAFVEAAAVPAGMQITDVLSFTGGKNQIKQNGTWMRAKVALATSTSLGDPAPLFASQLGLPAGSIASGMTIGKARITLKR